MTLSEPTGSKGATTALPETTELRPVWIIVLGALIVLTGIAAIAFPLASTLAVEVLVGSLFLTVGVFTTTHAIIDRGSEGTWWELLIGLLHIAAGVIFLANPLGGILALTVMLGATFVAEGVLRIFMALRMERSRKLFLLIASGALSILLGGMVFAGLANGASLTLIGVLLGVNFIFAGVALITVGMAAKTSGSD
ncbi:HdeD family acid-resistance protein [Ruegeria sp. HKCCD8929]|uniref:HdeD family acid-resistance protein n=1 Tax=Ruegeria sp. HKCCD8929 TaxID=2683006 RepID=UPI001488AE81|nr:DUF308 domain-containing protein [Ruegeria sp. HKCCD8929]